MSADEQPEVRDVPERSRFEILVDGEVAGFTEYVDPPAAPPGLRVFPHTVVDPAFEGRGLGSRLIGAALDATRTAGLGVAPQCSMVAHVIATHPGDHLDLVPPEHRDALDAG